MNGNDAQVKLYHAEAQLHDTARCAAMRISIYWYDNALGCLQVQVIIIDLRTSIATFNMHFV